MAAPRRRDPPDGGDGRGGDRWARRGVRASRIGPTADRRAARWRDLQASLVEPGRRGACGRPRVPHGREPRRGPRAVDDGDDPRPPHDRRRRRRPDPAVPRRGPHVRAGDVGRRTATPTPGCASSAGPRRSSSSSSPTPRATTTGRSRLSATPPAGSTPTGSWRPSARAAPTSRSWSSRSSRRSSRTTRRSSTTWSSRSPTGARRSAATGSATAAEPTRGAAGELV